jgi:hypothetical protein
LASEKLEIERAKAIAAHRAEAIAAVNTRLLGGFGSARLEPDGGSLMAYVQKSEYESIPFPNRRKLIEELGKMWCDRGSSGIFATLGIYDVRTGEKLGTYSCTLSRALLHLETPVVRQTSFVSK